MLNWTRDAAFTVDRRGTLMSVPTPFTPGLEISCRFFEDAVRPIVDAEIPSDRYAAANIGSGSEVLGFDTRRSADHEWGPRLQLFLTDDDLTASGAGLFSALTNRLPKEFGGLPTNFAATAEPGIGVMALTDGPVNHRVAITSLPRFAIERLGFDATLGVTVFDWLAAPTQRLAEVTAGGVFHDPGGELEIFRRSLAWYPVDLWRHVLACQWRRIGQEEAFVGRAAEVGDELGSAVITARLARELMVLRLLQLRCWPTYAKWLGSTLAAVDARDQLGSELRVAVAATSWPDREDALCTAYELVATGHNELGLTPPLDPSVRTFHQRPFRVIDAGRFVDALRASITDRTITDLPIIGTANQFLDNTDALEPAVSRSMLHGLLPHVS